LFPGNLPADKLKNDGPLLSLQDKSEDSTLERLKDPIQEFLNKQDAVPKVGMIWLPCFWITSEILTAENVDYCLCVV
jgi:hypothetical protein